MTIDPYDIKLINPRFDASTEEFLKLLETLDLMILRGICCCSPSDKPVEFQLSEEPQPLRDRIEIIQLTEHPKTRRPQ